MELILTCNVNHSRTSPRLPSTRYWSAAKEVIPVSQSLRTIYLHKAVCLPPDSLDILVPKPIYKNPFVGTIINAHYVQFGYAVFVSLALSTSSGVRATLAALAH